MNCTYNPYTLPTIDFVGGETQELVFNVFFHEKDKPYSLIGCEYEFSIVSSTSKNGAPIPLSNPKGTITKDTNALTVRLEPEDTVNLFGKYIYQISIRGVDGDVEIPKQGILYIANNINKSFIG